MSRENKYGLISVIFRSRFLLRTEAEYCAALGVSYETVVNNRASLKDMEMYYGMLVREAAKWVELPLDEIIGDYLRASEMYLSLDWGDRSHKASKRRFCRLLYRIAVTPGIGLTTEERLKFKIKEADDRLLALFFPAGFGEEPAVNICFILLFAFDIIRPWSGDNFRGRDIRDEDTVKTLGKLRELIETLKEDAPRLGLLEKPLVFAQLVEMIDRYLREPETRHECTATMMVAVIMDIVRVCRAMVVSEEQRIEDDKLHGLYMHGIWVDDADEGKSRFWIFPENVMGAFCYSREGVAWRLDVYDFRVRRPFSSEYMDTFLMLTPRGNLNYTLNPQKVIASDQLVSGSFEVKYNESTGDIESMTLYELPQAFPEWLNWRKWEQLPPEDERYREFRAVLAQVYDPESPHSMLLHNTAPELSDCVNNLVGRDNKYLYIYDWRPKRFAMKEMKPQRFSYVGDVGEYATHQGLFELNITEETPLYAIPKDVPRKNYGDAELNRLAEVLADADHIVEAYVIHSPHIPFPRLVFPTYGLSIALNMEVLQKVGTWAKPGCNCR